MRKMNDEMCEKRKIILSKIKFNNRIWPKDQKMNGIGNGARKLKTLTF
jgi:hypothetical protein